MCSIAPATAAAAAVAGTWAYFATIATSYMFTLVPFVSLVFGWHPVTFSRPFALASTAYLVRQGGMVCAALY
jgi:hypothetical protein